MILSSKEKRIDDKYYVELSMIEEWLRSMNIKMGIFDSKEYKPVCEIKKNLDDLNTNVNIDSLEKYNCKVMDQGLLVNEFNLY